MKEMEQIIDSAVRRIAEERFNKMRKEVIDVYAKYLPSERMEFSDETRRLTKGFGRVITFDKELNESIMNHLIDQEKKSFTDLAKNLSKYLEVHTAGY